MNHTNNLRLGNYDSNCKYKSYSSEPFKIDSVNTHRPFKFINPSVYTNKFDKNFERVRVSYPENKNVWINSIDDGKVKSQHDGSLIRLDNPPLDTEVKFKDLDRIYIDKNFNNYKTGFLHYKDIEAGEILYFIDTRNKNPYHTPIFTGDYDTDLMIYKDPMGSSKHHYNREQNDKKNNIHKQTNFKYGLSWLEDTNEQREDIISRQMYKRNQTRYIQY
jgi:hypothetical protein